MPESTHHKDKFNTQSIVMHDDRSPNFKKAYSDNLSDCYANAFKFGRKKMGPIFYDYCRMLKKGGRVLDAGCGTGYFLNILQEKSFDSIGIDMSTEMLKTARSNYPNITVQFADAQKLPFTDNSFDGVVSIETLRYFSDRQLLLAELFRVLKPGGILFISAAPLLSLNMYGIFNMLCRFAKLRLAVSCFQSFETVRSFEKRLRQAGFKNITIKGFFFGPYFLLDKISSKVASFLMRKFEKMDDKLSKNDLLRNLSNHLVAIAEK